MKGLVFHFLIHQPFILKDYRFAQIGLDHHYEADEECFVKTQWLARRSLVPAIAMFAKLASQYQGRFKIVITISGVSLDLFQIHAPEVINQLKKLARSGAVEFTKTPYFFGLACERNPEEWKRQVIAHQTRINQIFGLETNGYYHPSRVASAQILSLVNSNHWGPILGSLIPFGKNRFKPVVEIGHFETKVLPTYKPLSDDLEINFSNPKWTNHPLNAVTFANWINEATPNNSFLLLSVDIKTLGQKHQPESGIFPFFEQLISILLNSENNQLLHLPLISDYNNQTETALVDIDKISEFNETETYKYTGNNLQADALDTLFEIQEDVLTTKDPMLINDWGRMQTIDYFYNMRTDLQNANQPICIEGDSPTPYDVYIAFMNIISDLQKRVEAHKTTKK